MTRSRWACCESCVRVFIALLAASFLVMLSGCWVSSINGLDEEEFFRPDPDITFDESLTGTWQQTEENCTKILIVSGSNRTYDLELMAQGEKCSKAGDKAHYLARLVKLDNHFFLDVYPMPADVCEMCLPLHWIFLATFDKSTLTMTPIDSEWLKQASAQKTLTLIALPDTTDTITSSAKELKEFCRKYADNKEVFNPTSNLTFKRSDHGPKPVDKN